MADEADREATAQDKPPRSAHRPGSVAFSDAALEDKPPRSAHRPGSVAFSDAALEHEAARLRPASSVHFYDQPGSAPGARAAFTPASDGSHGAPPPAASSRPGTIERPSSVLLIDSAAPGRVSAAPGDPPAADAGAVPRASGPLPEHDADELAAETEIKDRLRGELAAVSKRSAGKELVHQEPQGEQQDVPAARAGTARAGTARGGTTGHKSKPGTARGELKSRGRSQNKSRGVPGTIGVLWKEAYRPVVAPTTADTGYRHVLTVHSLVPGGAADATGRVKVGDKLIAVQDAGQSSRKVVVGMKKEDIRRALHGEAGMAISLELLRATDMGAKKAFLVNLVRTHKPKGEPSAGATRLPQIGKPHHQDRRHAHVHRGADREQHLTAQAASQAVPFTPSVKQTGWAKGVRLRGNMAPADADLKEYHSLSEEDPMDPGLGNDSVSDPDDEDDELKAEQKRLRQLSRLKVSDKLTRKEQEQLEVMKKHKQQLEEESKRHAEREVYLLNAIHQCEDELMKARELFCDVARRATGNPLVLPLLSHLGGQVVRAV